MSVVNLAAVDLNLLLLVATVLEERSATRAAARLRVTQSAVSNGLRRARALFGDPLVLRAARGLTPTARGDALLPPLRAWIAEAQRLVAAAPRFDPARTERTFTLACTDAVALTLLDALVRRLARRAPGARLRVLTLDRLLADDALARGDCDLLVGAPPEIPRGHLAEALYRDPLACILRRDHPLGRARLTLPRFAALPHAELALFGAHDDAIDRALARQGLARTIRFSLPHFAALPLAVCASDAVATVGRRLARVLRASHPLRVLAPPLALPALEIKLLWHERAALDPAVTFLRGIVREAGAPVGT